MPCILYTCSCNSYRIHQNIKSLSHAFGKIREPGSDFHEVNQEPFRPGVGERADRVSRPSTWPSGSYRGSAQGSGPAVRAGGCMQCRRTPWKPGSCLVHLRAEWNRYLRWMCHPWVNPCKSAFSPHSWGETDGLNRSEQAAKPIGWRPPYQRKHTTTVLAPIVSPGAPSSVLGSVRSDALCS